MSIDIFELFTKADALFWGYIGFSIIIFFGSYLSFKSGGFQFRGFPYVIHTFFQEIFKRAPGDRGVHPIKTFFASIGGMLGVGNIVGVATAIQLGGPGALLWIWVAGFLGTLIKYAEIYLGLKYRVKNEHQSYDGGPMYFLKTAFGVKWVSVVICVLLCIYGAEFYQFNVVVDTIVFSWGVNRFLVAFLLLAIVLYGGMGGLSRVANICSLVMPIFMFGYVIMCLWIIGMNIIDLPSVLMLVMKSAFTEHAAIGGFAGSTMMLAIQNGMASACYASDVGIGYDSTIQSESLTVYPERQARMAFFGVFLNIFLCTLSCFVVLLTGLWQLPISGGGPIVQIALEQHFPFMNVITPFFIFILGYTTLIAYFLVGIKCARYLHPRLGPTLYICYTITVLSFFAFFDQTQALLVMRTAGALLLIINLAGIYQLRNEIIFTTHEIPIQPEENEFYSPSNLAVKT